MNKDYMGRHPNTWFRRIPHHFKSVKIELIRFSISGTSMDKNGVTLCILSIYTLIWPSLKRGNGKRKNGKKAENLRKSIKKLIKKYLTDEK